MLNQPTVVSIFNSEYYRWGANCDAWRLLESPGLSITQERIPPGEQEPRHYHHAQQFIFILFGQASLEMDGQIYPLRSRQGMEVRGNQPHQLRNDGVHELVYLVISAPSVKADRALME
jgi:mannose-6-phosphate isomerase-like protein (cupin superfamily)